jgi:soluble lytic murein transglycosylase
LARDGMAKLKNKPPKTDLRWRLVYPQNYYKQVQKYAQDYNNNSALIMAIIREESSFNSEAQSEVGAIGLMQLMPSTAHDIGDKHGINFNTYYLFNPELNIRLGNLYYSTIKKMLEGKDVSAIAAYNGGVGSVTNWKTSLRYNDADEFVEQIPYEETKNYVIKVFRSYWNYIRIYQKQ